MIVPLPGPPWLSRRRPETPRLPDRKLYEFSYIRQQSATADEPEHRERRHHRLTARLRDGEETAGIAPAAAY